jgi:hypothetical protein
MLAPRFPAAARLVFALALPSCAPPSPYAGGFIPWQARRLTSPAAASTSSKEAARDLAIASAYAPAVFHATHTSARPKTWDTPTRVDFDGDRVASNNEESLRSGKHAIPPAVYYAVLETETHFFLTYGLYHAIDWSTSPPVLPYTWHENDMENLQVVVEKREVGLGVVVLLATQAHLGTTAYTAPGSGITSAEIDLSGRPIRLVGADGKGRGNHVAIFVESGGHGIYSVADEASAFSTADPLTLTEGALFAPPSYTLLPIKETFWDPYLDGTGTGDGKLMDGAFTYYEYGMRWDLVPRHLDSDRLSGPCKDDSGILPFAFGFALFDLDLGSLFFNPAEKYKESLSINRPWSTTYLRHPYRDPM